MQMMYFSDTNRFVQHRNQLIFRNRLGQVMQGIHVIALADEFEMGGYENDFGAVTVLPDAARQADAGDLFHFDIQKENIPALLFLIGEEECLGGRVAQDFAGMSQTADPIGDQAAQGIELGFVVIADCDMVGITAFLNSLFPRTKKCREDQISHNLLSVYHRFQAAAIMGADFIMAIK